MKIVVFGLVISSSWGNGHATLWRGLCRSLAKLRHHVIFFEHDVPYYAGNRDFWQLPWGELVLYGDWEGILWRARQELADADVAIVTSYCPDGIAAAGLLFDFDRTLRVFYDLDTPVTLSRLKRGETLSYIGPRGLGDFDLVLSYTGGAALDALRDRLGARRVMPLYGHVDPEVHRPVEPELIAAIVDIDSGHLPETLEGLTRNAPLFQKISNNTLKGCYYQTRGDVLKDLWESGAAGDYLDRALVEYAAASYHFELAEHRRYRANVENNLGLIYFQINRCKEAHEHLDRARRIFSVVNRAGCCR